MLQTGEVLQGRYQIIQMIGKGGMSTVYQARDLNNQNLLAIKDVNRSGKEENQEMEQKLAVAEGHMLMQLSNPHLPRIYEIIENQDTFMLVMDFIQGESLDRVIRREGPQSVDLVLQWGMQICDVFHYLHSQPTPIIYRDMKPANIMLRPDGQLMMIDFGTARTLKENVTLQADTICLGTEGFAAPEQFGGQGQSDARTDVFSLGATLYNMVTGHSPSEKPVGIRRLGSWNPELENTPIAQIIYKATRNDPNERYQTVLELKEDLQKAATGSFSKAQSGGGWITLRPKTKGANGNSGSLAAGLSGLLSKSNTGFLNRQAHTAQIGQNAADAPQQSESHSTAIHEWQHSAMVPAINNMDNQTQEYAQPQHNEDNQIWLKLTMIGALVAAIFVVLAIVLLVLNIALAAIVFLMIAMGAAALSVVAVVMSRK